MDIMEAREAKRPLREGILPLPKEGLADHHRSKIFVEVPGGSGPIRKEIGELSQAEIRNLEPGLRIRVVNCLLERYVVGQGQNELLMGPQNPGIGVEVDRDTLERYGRRVS
jgi:hypothetical protein